MHQERLARFAIPHDIGEGSADTPETYYRLDTGPESESEGEVEEQDDYHRFPKHYIDFPEGGGWNADDVCSLLAKWRGYSTFFAHDTVKVSPDVALLPFLVFLLQLIRTLATRIPHLLRCRPKCKLDCRQTRQVRYRTDHAVERKLMVIVPDLLHRDHRHAAIASMQP